MDIKEIINLPVYTESGYYLGKVVKVKVDPQTGSPLQYFVKSKNFLRNLFRGSLIIHETQVVSISREKMVVRDTLKKISQAVPSPIG